MECSHILLGRPWQYDNRTSYDGRKNTYTVERDGVKYTLMPTNDDVKGKSKIVMFGKKTLLEEGELIANSRLEKAEKGDLFEGVMVGSVMCPFVQDKDSKKHDIAGVKGQVQQVEPEDVLEMVQVQALIEDSWYPPSTMMVGVPLWTNWFLYSGFSRFLAGFQKAGVVVPSWDMRIFHGGEYGAEAPSEPSVPLGSNDLYGVKYEHF